MNLNDTKLTISVDTTEFQREIKLLREAMERAQPPQSPTSLEYWRSVSREQRPQRVPRSSPDVSC